MTIRLSKLTMMLVVSGCLAIAAWYYGLTKICSVWSEGGTITGPDLATYFYVSIAAIAASSLFSTKRGSAAQRKTGKLIFMAILPVFLVFVTLHANGSIRTFPLLHWLKYGLDKKPDM